jgi:hypothetical protein
VDFDALQRDYFRCLYGRAAEPVQMLHEELERALMEYEPQAVTLGTYLQPEVVANAHDRLREAREADGTDEVQRRLTILEAQLEYGKRLTGVRQTGEAYERARNPTGWKRLKEERDALLSYIEAHPVDGAYHLGGIDLGIDRYVVDDQALRKELEPRDDG